MDNIKLSIIIVGYKSWGVLESCLNSFELYEPEASHEIIIVNNYPQDINFGSFAKKNPDIKLINNEGNYGFSNGCNLGARHAIGEYLLFLNPDTELTNDDAVDTMLALLSNNDDIGITSCRSVTPSGKIERELLFSNPWLLIAFVRQLYKLVFRQKIEREVKHSEEVWYPDWVSGSILMISSVLFWRIGGWNQERFWMYHEDPDICNRVRQHNQKIALVRNKVIQHIGGGTSRKNTQTTIMAKTEVMISSHNYIQINSHGISRILLHGLFSATSILILLFKSLVSLLMLKGAKSKVYLLTITGTMKYYLNAIQKRSWKSPRILEYEKSR